MAENEEEHKHGDGTLLIAQVRAYLIDGKTVDLLPFKHEKDVRSEVDKFIADWAKTGYLLQGNFVYPWHQVKEVEVVSVQVLRPAEAESHLQAWREDTAAQKALWKTRSPEPKTGGDVKS